MDEIKKSDATQLDDASPVTITKGQLQSILSEIDALKRGRVFEKPKRVTERTADIRIYEGKPVIWYGNVKEVWDDNQNKNVAYMDIKLDGEDKLITVPYVKFLNEPNKVKVKIVSQKAEEIVQSQGRMTAQNPNPAHDPATGRPLESRPWSAREIDLEVTSVKYQATIEILEGELVGEILTLNSECLNQ